MRPTNRNPAAGDGGPRKTLANDDGQSSSTKIALVRKITNSLLCFRWLRVPEYDELVADINELVCSSRSRCARARSLTAATAIAPASLQASSRDSRPTAVTIRSSSSFH